MFDKCSVSSPPRPTLIIIAHTQHTFLKIQSLQRQVLLKDNRDKYRWVGIQKGDLFLINIYSWLRHYLALEASVALAFNDINDTQLHYIINPLLNLVICYTTDLKLELTMSVRMTQTQETHVIPRSWADNENQLVSTVEILEARVRVKDIRELWRVRSDELWERDVVCADVNDVGDGEGCESYSACWDTD